MNFTTTSEEKKRFLTAKDILAAEDMDVEDVFIEQWKGWVRLRGLSGQERDRFETDIFKFGSGKDETSKGDFTNMRAKLVSLTAIDQKGNRLFSYQDAVKLGKKSAAALDKLFAVAQRLSGLRKEDVKELQKNLSGGPKDNSTTD